MHATMSHAPRQLMDKTKTRDEKNFGFLKPLKAKPFTPRATAPVKALKPVRGPSDSRLLAGYLAHEFLTKGSLFGQPWDPARADAEAVSAAAYSVDHRKPMKQVVSQKGKPAEPKAGDKRKFESYAQLSGLVMGKTGLQIPGIVNPTQLTRFLNLQ